MSPAERDAPAVAVGSAPYSVVHLVVGETAKDLIESQVVDHMRCQATTNGAARPARVVVAFLEAARVAARGATRRRIRELRRRAPELEIVLLPFVGRLGVRRNARLLGRRLRRVTIGDRVVIHCRGESAVEWADALRGNWPRSGVVLDVRGALPEEVLFERGFDGPDGASADALRVYHANFAILHGALARTDRLLCVSDSMREWLAGIGVPRGEIRRVPCCVDRLVFDPERRERLRRELGVSDGLVFTYLGSVTRYQHVEDALLPFFKLALEVDSSAHLLCLTSDEARMADALRGAAIPSDAVTLRRVAQRDVPRYLSAADAGVLMRAASRMNRVSMPVKFAEYLSSGVPVIATRVTGWIDDIVERSGAGVVLDWFGASEMSRRAQARDACERIRREGGVMRAAALELCRSEFLWSRYVSDVRDQYTGALQ